MPSFKAASFISVLASWFAAALIYVFKAEEIAELKYEIQFIQTKLKETESKKVCWCGDLLLESEAKDKIIYSQQQHILYLEKMAIVYEEEEIDCVNLHHRIVEIESECGL